MHPHGWWMILKRNLGLLSNHLTCGWPDVTGRGTCWVIKLFIQSLVQPFNKYLWRPKYAPGLVGTTAHKEALFWSLRSSDGKHMNILFPKFQSFAYCFQNFCLCAHCLITVLLIHMAYERWIHSFIYFRPTVSRNIHKGISYYYIDFFFLVFTKHRTLKEKNEHLHIIFPIYICRTLGNYSHKGSYRGM